MNHCCKLKHFGEKALYYLTTEWTMQISMLLFFQYQDFMMCTIYQKSEYEVTLLINYHSKISCGFFHTIFFIQSKILWQYEMVWSRCISILNIFKWCMILIMFRHSFTIRTAVTKLCSFVSLKGGYKKPLVKSYDNVQFYIGISIWNIREFPRCV